jgi:azurin
MKMGMRELFVGCALSAASALGCGGDKSAAPPSPPPAAPAPQPSTQSAQPATAAPAAPAPVTVAPDESGVVHVTASDQMRFSAGKITVKAGQPITIELKNIGTLSKEAMGHNLVVLKAGNDPTAFAMKAVAAKATDYVPSEAQDQIIAHTKLLGPGESDTIKIESLAAGTYPFVCTFPGHAAIMNGQLVVE